MVRIRSNAWSKATWMGAAFALAIAGVSADGHAAPVTPFPIQIDTPDYVSIVRGEPPLDQIYAERWTGGFRAFTFAAHGEPGGYIAPTMTGAGYPVDGYGELVRSRIKPGRPIFTSVCSSADALGRGGLSTISRIARANPGHLVIGGAGYVEVGRVTAPTAEHGWHYSVVPRDKNGAPLPERTGTLTQAKFEQIVFKQRQSIPLSKTGIVPDDASLFEAILANEEAAAAANSGTATRGLANEPRPVARPRVRGWIRGGGPMALLTAVDLIGHAQRDGVAETAVGAAFGAIGFAVAERVAIYGATRLGAALGSAAPRVIGAEVGAAVAGRFASRAIPVVGWVLLVADVILVVGGATWEDVWDTYSGQIDKRHTFSPSTLPPADARYLD